MRFPDPAAALAAGVTVVTPNARVARALIARHDAAMLRDGQRAWPAVRAIGWSTWVGTLWRDALEADAAPPALRLLSASESHVLWQRIVGEDPAFRDAIMSTSGPARLAFEAWQLVHAWGEGGESWRAWRDQPGDAAIFARCAERYRREVAALSAIDPSEVPEHVRVWAPRVPAWRERTVALAGFARFTPQQVRLHHTLRDAGMQLATLAPRDGPAQVERVSAATPRDELVAALSWARDRAATAHDVGIAVVDLAVRADEVRALANDVLCPSLSQPGFGDRARPFVVAQARTLADHSMIATALRFVDLALHPLPRAEAAALMRSPAWSGPWVERAGAERAWIEDGRSRISWNEVAAALPQSGAVQLRTAIDGYPGGRQAPSAWAKQWRTLLTACGWPAQEDASADGHEARAAWERLLDSFSQLGAVQPGLAAREASALLRELAQRMPFEPRPEPAAIVIMDAADACALAFDALWVAGLSGQGWPRAPEPHPLLPLAWQRERGVPRSGPAVELAHATLATERLAQAAPQVVMSAPAAIEDYQSAPSALLDPRWPVRAAPPATNRVHQLWLARDVEIVRDDVAPAFGASQAPGGARTIDAQSACPFQAFAQQRLRVEPWPSSYEALSYAERGQLVHDSMAAFWSEVRTHQALLAMDDEALRARIAVAAETACKALRPPGRWQTLPAVVAAAEGARIAQIAWQWIVHFDRPRPPFAVAATEEKSSVALVGLSFRLRIDRIDTLHDGSVAIVDYKTGVAEAPKTWFDDRPRAPQLGLYALALRDRADVAAVAYAQLKAGKVKVLGVARERDLWRALATPDKVRPGEWTRMVAWWERELTAIAAEFRDGVATVSPVNPPGTCQRCNRQSLCRIGGAAAGEQEDEA
jgi:probable DNA repair protein